MAVVTRYVNTAGSVGTQDGTTSTAGSSGTAAFATLRQALDAIGSSVGSYAGSGNSLRIICAGSAADTSDTDQGAWDFTTTATEFIEIIGEQSPNHPNFTTTGSGIYSTSKYRNEATNRNVLYNNLAAHVRMEGLQAKATINNAGSYVGIKTANANVTASDADFRVGWSIVWEAGNGSVIGFESRPLGGGGAGTSKFYNCLSIDCSTGFNGEFVTTEAYNCTAVDGGVGFLSSVANGLKCVNCLAYNNTNPQDFLDGGAFASGTSYNAASDATAPGTNSRNSQTFTFVDSVNDNFHLASSDAGAKNFGTSDPASGLYDDDIDGETRSGSWDIGADEVPPPPPGPALMTVASPLRW